MSRYLLSSTLKAQITRTSIPTIRPFTTTFPTKMADKSPLDAGKGSIGSEFTEDGKIGGTAQKVGGAFDKDGTIGKEFTTDGAIGGAAQNSAEGKPAFDKEGVIGKQFQADGVIGQVGEKVGGPFAKDGAIGKNFNADGAVGGAVQDNLGDGKK